jgi:hypothetical protein
MTFTEIGKRIEAMSWREREAFAKRHRLRPWLLERRYTDWSESSFRKIRRALECDDRTEMTEGTSDPLS